MWTGEGKKQRVKQEIKSNNRKMLIVDVNHTEILEEIYYAWF